MLYHYVSNYSMKKHLLLWLCCLLPAVTFAQFPVGMAASLLVNGVRAGSAAAKNRPNKPGEFVTYHHVGQDSIPLKRTPENKLRGAAAASIQALEQHLATTHAQYLRPYIEYSYDGTTAMLYVQRIQGQQPKWDVSPYQQEYQAYVAESQRRVAATQQREQQARQLAQRQHAARQDSLSQLTRRRHLVADSLRAAVWARTQQLQDSLSTVARRQLEAAEEKRASLINYEKAPLSSGPFFVVWST